ncbi:serine/threonine-protein kinase [Sorangium sp. So ce145]|uniref:serine/threonine-protein kinase n=1 Tax=Sorangium sp. So ce145 TaxID=3133285 RepID=UPI003F63F364
MNYSYDPNPLAVGGEKSVHKAVCVETRLDVVVKFLKRPYTQEDVMRFRHEIQRLRNAKMTAGAGVSTILDFNLDYDPPFYVEEYFPDGSLAQKMAAIFRQGSRFQEGAALGYCRQILNALQGIHNSNQIHRDIKPQNIMFRAADKQMIITDMGIGRTLARPTPLQTRAFVGTRGYAAPEQENASATDHRTDLYPVGVILHEMLTGERGAWNYNVYTGNPRVARLITGLMAFLPNQRYSTAYEAVLYIDRLGLSTR